MNSGSLFKIFVIYHFKKKVSDTCFVGLLSQLLFKVK